MFYITTGNHRNNLHLYNTESKSEFFQPKLTKMVKTRSLISKLNIRHFERIFFRLLPKKESQLTCFYVAAHLQISSDQCFLQVRVFPGGGGGLPYEMDGDARRKF